mgnify:CR=1 FL=1
MEQLNQITLPLGEHGEGWKKVLDIVQDLSDNDNIYIKRGGHITLYLEPREAHKWATRATNELAQRKTKPLRKGD